MEVWAIRSIDGGKTWIDHQSLSDSFNANFFGLIQTRTGHIVMPLQHLTSNPCRLITCSFTLMMKAKLGGEVIGLTWEVMVTTMALLSRQLLN
ncbi:MAG: glycoside hydrolase [Armatimonadetes bacterium]|nr:glycoside hydrolase [Armatimonadota bacterium]MDW8027913.1 sialidase family protein [Armatimonadota bacterium]